MLEAKNKSTFPEDDDSKMYLISKWKPEQQYIYTARKQ